MSTTDYQHPCPITFTNHEGPRTHHVHARFVRPGSQENQSSFVDFAAGIDYKLKQCLESSCPDRIRELSCRVGESEAAASGNGNLVVWVSGWRHGADVYQTSVAPSA